MLNIAICDDDIQITGKIERLLQDIAKRNFTCFKGFFNLIKFSVQFKDFLFRYNKYFSFVAFKI